MKKTLSIFGYILFVFTIVLPFGITVSSFFGYDLELANYPAFAFLTASLAVIATVLSVVSNQTVNKKASAVLYALTAPLSLINALVHILSHTSVFVFASMFISVCCCFYLAIKQERPTGLKTTSLIFSAVMALPIASLIFIASVFDGFSHNTVICTVNSPDGDRYAQIVENSQGALGGNTFVYVYDTKEINTVVRLSKKLERVYTGEWGEAESITVYWKDDNCLVVNSKEYYIE